MGGLVGLRWTIDKGHLDWAFPPCRLGLPSLFFSLPGTSPPPLSPFLQIDLDGDGSNITYDEFVKIMVDIRLLTQSQTGKGTNKFDLASAFANR